MISIITPCLNAEKYVNRCLVNVINQGIPSIEHIFVDGGSTDSTLHILYALQSTYPHIRVFSKPDRGQSHAMNRGIRMAKYDLISFLNVDDEYYPYALQTVINIFKGSPDFVFIVGKCQLRDSAGQPLSINKPTKLDSFRLLLSSRLYPYPSNPSSYFYDKKIHSVVGMYLENLHYTMDLEFILRMSRVANIIYVDSTLGCFTLHADCKTISGAESAKKERLLWQQKYINSLDVLTSVRFHLARIAVRAYDSMWLVWSYVSRASSRLSRLWSMSISNV